MRVLQHGIGHVDADHVVIAEALQRRAHETCAACCIEDQGIQIRHTLLHIE